MSAVLFYLFAAVLLGSSMFVVLNRNPMYSVVALVFGFAHLAGIYFLLEATFIGILQILVYAGAIMVLFLFVIMLLNVESDAPRKGLIHLDRWWYALMAVIFLGLFLLVVRAGTAGLVGKAGAQSAGNGSVREIGMALFTRYLLPFEVAALLLTVALVGTVFLAKRRI